jgi:16S rRNA (guanine1516-N2)-methyltransferase
LQRYKLYISDGKFLGEAQQLAEFTKCIDIVTTVSTETATTDELLLQLDSQGLAIITQDFKPLYVSEIYSKLPFRQKSLSQELLIQAIKLNQNDNVFIIDATAGLAKDAALLGIYGYKVLMLEHNPILATIVYYALIHQHLPSNNLSLVFTDSIDYLESYKGKTPDCIYLDPMFNECKSVAKAKKEMQIIQLLSYTTDSASLMTNDQILFKKAQQLSQKIVVKRDNKQENLVVNPQPSYIKQGKTIRYDVYVIS